MDCIDALKSIVVNIASLEVVTSLDVVTWLHHFEKCDFNSNRLLCINKVCFSIPCTVLRKSDAMHFDTSGSSWSSWNPASPQLPHLHDMHIYTSSYMRCNEGGAMPRAVKIATCCKMQLRKKGFHSVYKQIHSNRHTCSSTNIACPLLGLC